VPNAVNYYGLKIKSTAATIVVKRQKQNQKVYQFERLAVKNLLIWAKRNGHIAVLNAAGKINGQQEAIPDLIALMN
jgi:hypothetical protein